VQGEPSLRHLQRNGQERREDSRFPSAPGTRLPSVCGNRCVPTVQASRICGAARSRRSCRRPAGSLGGPTRAPQASSCVACPSRGVAPRATRRSWGDRRSATGDRGRVRHRSNEWGPRSPQGCRAG
jgi:hypothetical protein